MERKRTQRIYRVVFGTALVLLPAALSAQTDSDSSTNQQMQPGQQQSQPNSGRAHTQNSTHDSNATPGMTGQEMKDKMFLRKSAQGGLAEVKMGQLAAEKGSSDEVKTFGTKMVADHTMLNNSMKPIADSMGVRLPKDLSKADQAEYDKLSSLSGAEFDTEYITSMVKDHHKDLHEFHAEAMATNDPSLKEAVEKGERVIREHTRMISTIAKEKGIATAPAGRPDAGSPSPQ